MTRVSNTTLYTISSTITKPEIPKYYIEEQDRWVENINSPDYHQALQLYELSKGDAALNFIIDNYEIEEEHEINIKQKLMLELMRGSDESLEFAYKKYIIFGGGLAELVNSVCLTEYRVYRYFAPLQATANRSGVDLLEYDLKFSINIATNMQPIHLAGMQLVHPLDEMVCCIDNNINFIEWNRNSYTLDEMAQVVAIWRLNKIVESHKSDEVAIHQERETNKARR